MASTAKLNTASPMPATVARETATPTAPIFGPWPAFADDEINAVNRVLRSGKVNYWTGDECRQFEQEYAAHCGVNHAVALANGSVALEAALQALDIGPGDEVIVTPRTFIASASSVALRGARPVFADVDPVSQNITAASVAKVLSPRVKAIIAVHLAGWPCDMAPIMALARAQDRPVKVIEDCAQAHGARYHNRPVGGIGDIGVFSFCQDKIITTGGEGGLLVTNDSALWRRVWAYKDHGKNYDTVYDPDANTDGLRFRWLHESFGSNWRMTEMQAAIGRLQLLKLPSWLNSRQRHARLLDERLSQLPALRVTSPAALPEISHAYYKYYAFIRPERLKPGWDRDRILAAIKAQGVPCFSGCCPEVYREKAFVNSGLEPARRLKIARFLGQTSLMFLVHPTLQRSALLATCRAVEKVMAMASR